ncbi:MAG: nitrous oxide reductase family maturation protein NosD [Cyclobacteriaceae bacterium]
MRLRNLLTLALLAVLSSGQSKTLEVCSSCPIKGLQEAIGLANTGDSILVKPGVYPAINIELNKPITIIGMDGAVLDGSGEGYVLKVLADSVTISGFKIVNSGRSYTKDFAAIYAYRADHFRFLNLEIVDPFFGILLEKSKNGLVKNNKVYGVSKREDDSGNGIHMWHCSEVIVENNEVYGLRDGIYLEFVDRSKVWKNYTHNNIRYGLHFMFSNEDEYLENTFENNGAGVAVMFSKFIVMKENRFIRNWGTASYGLLLKEIYDAEVVNNTFTENTIGIFIEGSTRINYTQNQFEQNGWAIKVSGGCYENLFFKNNFIGNSFDVSYNTKMNDNSFNGNYWSDYTGYDLDKDGIGDVPYRPVKLFSYIVNKTPETIILLRSLFVDIINFSEKVSPVFTPDDLIDNQPSTFTF